jgi:acetyl esterase/lipase
MSQPYMHRGSRDNLLGKEANFALEQNLSNDLQVSPQTPPTFIFQTDEDKPVPAENCVAYYLALRRAGVPAELHIYERGPHGVGLGRDFLGTNTWPQRCREWMANRGLVKLERADVDN